MTGTLVLRWAIAPEAAAAAGWEERNPVLEVRVPCATSRAAAWIVEGGSRRSVPLNEDRGECARDGALWHLDVRGLLHVTVRVAAEGVIPLYARTPLLSLLGIPGGRSELERVWLEPA